MTMQLQLSQLADLLGCDTPISDVLVQGTVIDSRKVMQSNLFIALQGEHVDGHDYIALARQSGASAALVSEKQDDKLPQLVVADVVQAFGLIAKYWRQQCATKVVAVTGSNGKTTVKEMVAAILKQCGSVVATLGNLNNELGVPLTLTRLDKTTDYAVIEMGANHPGEIAQLVKLADPQVAVINNVASAHLEGFGDLAGVAKAKAEIFTGLTKQGVGVFNADMAFAEDWKQLLANKEYISFALENNADIMAKDCQLGAVSSHFMVALDDVLHYINLPLPGLHNVANALAAIAVTSALNIPVTSIVKGLSTVQGAPHRLQLHRGIEHSQLIDDSYNANPDSYQQALAALNAFPGKHWLILGDFAELGTECEQIHHQMGLTARESGVEQLFTVGEMSEQASNSFGDGARHFTNINDLQQVLQRELTEGVTCLIKGSRFMQLDKLADVLSVEGEG